MPRKKKNKPNTLRIVSVTVSVLILAVFVGVGIFLQSSHEKESEAEAQVEAEEVSQIEKTHMLLAELLANLPVEATKIAVYDLGEQKVIYGKKESEPSNLASLAKIITARALRDLPLREVCITEDDLELVGDQGLVAGECYLSSDATTAMLVSSSNDLVAALDRSYEGALAESLDGYIATNGLMVDMQHPSGWDFGKNEKQSTVTALDIMHTMIDLVDIAPDVVRATTFPTYQFGEHTLEHTYPAVASVPRLEFVKTGYTDLAGGNMAGIVEPTNGQRVGVVLMGSGFEGRFADFQNIISTVDTVYRFFEVL